LVNLQRDNPGLYPSFDCWRSQIAYSGFAFANTFKNGNTSFHTAIIENNYISV